ncbi:MAG: hypothetical protein V4598_19265 [Bdellovibrionota bacterium]
MKNAIHTIVASFTLLLLTSCLMDEKPKETNSQLLVSRGDIVAVSFNTDSLVAFNANGTLKSVLYTLPNTADSIGGIGWLDSTNEILIAVDGAPDRIDAISIVTGTARNFYLNTTNFTGTMLGIAQLKGASTDVIATEGTTLERFNSSGIRRTNGANWPLTIAAPHTNHQQIIGLSTGNWLSCSGTATATTRITTAAFTTAPTLVSTVTAPAGTTLAQGCNELSDGRVIVAWAGAATDIITLYSSTLTGGVNIVNNIQSTFADPRNVAIGEYDEIYIPDATRNMIVQIDTAGTVVREFGNSVLNSPRGLLVVPPLN